jgi:ubiquinone/menaquinone biosynthesis C-methylase UbiE
MSDPVPPLRENILILELGPEERTDELVAVLEDPVRGLRLPLNELQLAVVRAMDAARDLTAVAAAVTQALGIEVSPEDLAEFIEAMDESLVLQTDRGEAEIHFVRSDRNAHIKSTWKDLFDRTVSVTYDSTGPWFLQLCGRRLAELLGDDGHGRILDLAAGTGNVALSAAGSAHRPWIVALDLSRGMLERLLAKKAAAGQLNVVAVAGDAYHLPFADKTFDVVTCAIAIPFFPHIGPVLAETRRVLKPGWMLAISTLGDGHFAPASEEVCRLVMEHCGDYRYDSEERCWTSEEVEGLLRRAGFESVRSTREVSTIHFSGGEEFWYSTFWYEGVSIWLREAPAEVIEQVRAEGIARVDGLGSSEGLDLPMVVIYAFGRTAPG